MEDRIEIGDTVRIYFDSHPNIKGIVLNIPQATGDSWIVKAPEKRILYIQQFDYIELLEKKEPLTVF